MEELHLPWTNDKLEELVRQIINTGETSKVDFKATTDLTEVQQQAEMLKDVSAMANTFEYHYKNHGFIILGIAGNKIVGTAFKQTADAMQATIDELMKRYIEPFVPTHLRIFNEGEKTWGVLVIPPSRLAPHAFMKDIHKRYRGDVYVRRGTTTEKAQYNDFIRFFRMHVDEQTYSFQLQLKDAQEEIQKLREEINTKSVEPTEDKSVTKKKTVIPEKIIERKTPTNLLEEIDEVFAKEIDPVQKGLMDEARKINVFLESNHIPWNLDTANKKVGEDILQEIEHVCMPFWTALSRLVEKDEKAKFENTIVDAFTFIARQYQPPSGTYFNDYGQYIRYYPLLVSLYIVFIVGTFKKRDTLMKKVKNIQLSGRTIYDEPYSIGYILFYARRASEIFQMKRPDYPHQKWCDPIASCIKALLPKILSITDVRWNLDQYFYIGEFILTLIPIDVTGINTPSSGLYLFMNESDPTIRRFLSQNFSWIEKVFDSPLKDILTVFDERAHNLAVSSGCFGDGFQHKAVETAYPDKPTPQ